MPQPPDLSRKEIDRQIRAMLDKCVGQIDAPSSRYAMEASLNAHLRSLVEQGLIKSGGQAKVVTAGTMGPGRLSHIYRVQERLRESSIYGSPYNVAMEQMVRDILLSGLSLDWVVSVVWTAEESEWHQLREECTTEGITDWEAFEDRLPKIPGACQVFSDPGPPETRAIVDYDFEPVVQLRNIQVGRVP